jgi:hypothetical protein
VTIRDYIQHVEVSGIRQPLLRAAHYDLELQDGTGITAVRAVADGGRVIA